MTAPATRSEAIRELRAEVVAHGARAEVVLLSRDDADALAEEYGVARVELVHGLRVKVDNAMQPGWLLVLAKADFQHLRTVKQTMTPGAWREKLAQEFAG